MRVRIKSYSPEKGKGMFEELGSGKKRPFYSVAVKLAKNNPYIKRIIPNGAVAYLTSSGELTETPSVWDKIKNFFRRAK